MSIVACGQWVSARSPEPCLSCRGGKLADCKCIGCVNGKHAITHLNRSDLILRNDDLFPPNEIQPEPETKLPCGKSPAMRFFEVPR